MKSRTPKAGELWARPNHPVEVVVLSPQGSNKFMLATINTQPKSKPMTLEELKPLLAGYECVGRIIQR